MEWNQKYWDIICNIYLTPSYLGWKPIKRKAWGEAKDGWVSVREADIEQGAHALYSRKPLSDSEKIKFSLSNKEEILNHVFNVTFAIAGDPVISRLLCDPLGIDDSGPFLSLGREVLSRYDLGENVTQQDGFFITKHSAICIELKLNAKSSLEQIAKYVALIVCEEEKSGNRFHNVGLMFIVPEKAISAHWKKTGLAGPTVSAELFEQLDKTNWHKTINKLFEDKRQHMASVLDRLKLTVISWTTFRDALADIENELDCSTRGDQTLYRLLAGLRAQINAHQHTGVL
jgi:hypothetical protein